MADLVAKKKLAKKGNICYLKLLEGTSPDGKNCGKEDKGNIRVKIIRVNLCCWKSKSEQVEKQAKLTWGFHLIPDKLRHANINAIWSLSCYFAINQGLTQLVYTLELYYFPVHGIYIM